MQTYLIFGDPRRSENRMVWTADIPTSAYRLGNGTAEIAYRGHNISGAVLTVNEDSDTAADRHLSVLVSDQFPTDSGKSALKSGGWAEFIGEPPAPQRLPFRATLTVITPSDANGVAVWKKQTWMDEALVPTQRVSMPLADGVSVMMRCLAMNPTPGDRPQALLLAEPTDTYLGWAEHGWKRDMIREIPPLWQNLIRVSSAVEAVVVYVLGASLVESVRLHNVELLDPEDLLSTLPQDVADLTADALHDEGLDILIPEGFERTHGMPIPDDRARAQQEATLRMLVAAGRRLPTSDGETS